MGFILSGEYPQKKVFFCIFFALLFNFNLEFFSKIGIQISSVVPGYTVDSKITKSPLFNIFDTSIVALINKLRSGLLFL